MVQPNHVVAIVLVVEFVVVSLAVVLIRWAVVVTQEAVLIKFERVSQPRSGLRRNQSSEREYRRDATAPAIGPDIVGTRGRPGP